MLSTSIARYTDRPNSIIDEKEMIEYLEKLDLKIKYFTYWMAKTGVFLIVEKQ